MAEVARTLYGTTNESDSVPRALIPDSEFVGPVYSEDGRLVLNESFTCFASVRDEAALEEDVKALLEGDDYVETWRIWDCYADDWASFDLTVHRFEDYDLAIRQSELGMCAWRGCIDTRSRVLSSLDPEDFEQKCWQWRRDRRLPAK